MFVILLTRVLRHRICITSATTERRVDEPLNGTSAERNPMFVWHVDKFLQETGNLQGLRMLPTATNDP
jgi:hypothetical protein